MDKNIKGFDQNNEAPEVFPLDDTYEWVIDSLKTFSERLIKPRITSTYDIQGLSKLLLALRRLPLTTPGVYIILTVSNRVNEELRYYDLTICAEVFRLCHGGSVYDPAVGSDSYSYDIFSVTPNEIIEGDSYDIVNWIHQARELINLGGGVSVEDNSNNDEIDWDESAAEEYWDEK